MKLAIRTAQDLDASSIVALWKACELTRPWNDPRVDFSLAMTTPGSTVFIAEMDGELVGTVMTGFDGHRGWVYYLATKPDLQRQGIARDLLATAEKWLTALGCPKVELMVRDNNPAVGVYERLGWELQPVRVYARWLNNK